MSRCKEVVDIRRKVTAAEWAAMTVAEKLDFYRKFTHSSSWKEVAERLGRSHIAVRQWRCGAKNPGREPLRKMYTTCVQVNRDELKAVLMTHSIAIDPALDVYSNLNYDGSLVAGPMTCFCFALKIGMIVDKLMSDQLAVTYIKTMYGVRPPSVDMHIEARCLEDTYIDVKVEIVAPGKDIQSNTLPDQFAARCEFTVAGKVRSRISVILCDANMTYLMKRIQIFINDAERYVGTKRK